MTPRLVDLPAVLTLRLLAQGHLSREHLTISRGQLRSAITALRYKNARVRVPYILVGAADNVTYILWRSHRS